MYQMRGALLRSVFLRAASIERKTKAVTSRSAQAAEVGATGVVPT
jgi:hypothetical protein